MTKPLTHIDLIPGELYKYDSSHRLTNLHTIPECLTTPTYYNYDSAKHQIYGGAVYIGDIFVLLQTLEMSAEHVEYYDGEYHVVNRVLPQKILLTNGTVGWVNFPFDVEFKKM
jgi:hypothetical protein